MAGIQRSARKGELNVKQCTKCKVVKELGEFYKNITRTDGLRLWCKSCVKQYMSEYQKLNREKIRERKTKHRETPNGRKERAASDKRYNASPRGKKVVAAHNKRYALSNPEKRKAHHFVSNAIRGGKIIKPKNCSDCGAKGDVHKHIIHGHHADYTKLLEVTWLCPQCHTNEHKRLKTA